MASYNKMPDLISSSVKLDDGGHNMEDSGSRTTVTTVKNISRPSITSYLWKEIITVLRTSEAKKILYFLCFNVISTIILLTFCHSTNSMALLAYTYLTVFDILNLLSCLLSLWVKQQKPSPSFSFGYERFQVLAVFACTMLAQLGSFFIFKESMERVFEQPEVTTGRLLIGSLFGFLVHMIVIYGVENEAMDHVIAASSSSWLQEHMTDISESLCHFLPGLSHLLLPRVNPFSLIASASVFLVFVTHVLIDTKNYAAFDTFAAVCIAVMICGTMFPMSVYTGKILLQTTPSHILGQLDKVLREASTLDGVLEFRQEHFWTLSFGKLAGSVQVRVRRDADEQMVLAHIQNRLSTMVSVLTVQICKDDWTRPTTFHYGGNPAFSNPAVPARGMGSSENLAPSNRHMSPGVEAQTSSNTPPLLSSPLGSLGAQVDTVISGTSPSTYTVGPPSSIQRQWNPTAR